MASRAASEARWFGALSILALLTGCEPCAFVVGGHCQDRQHDEQQDEEVGRRPQRQQTQPPTPLYTPRARGSAETSHVIT